MKLSLFNINLQLLILYLSLSLFIMQSDFLIIRYIALYCTPRRGGGLGHVSVYKTNITLNYTLERFIHYHYLNTRHPPPPPPLPLASPSSCSTLSFLLFPVIQFIHKAAVP